jgi:hypothetical protein
MRSTTPTKAALDVSPCGLREARQLSGISLSQPRELMSSLAHGVGKPHGLFG